jgi:tRNA(Ile)-lysidine synthase
MNRPLSERFLRFLRRRQLVSPGDHVLVAVSGGVDSMVLLHLLRESRVTLGIQLTAAHYDHAMRPDSAADAQWVAGICRAWGVPLETERSSAALYGEAAARHARYAFLERSARRVRATRIATAHHADDQIETVLFRLLRGTGLRGLAGIPLRRGKIIRPLLRYYKRELEQYAQEHGLSFREDATNRSDEYARNRIRRALIPVLETIRADAPAAILSVARHAARSERAWRALLHELRSGLELRRVPGTTELARGKLAEYDGEIRARVLRAELRRFGLVPDRLSMRNILRFVVRGRSGSRLDLAGNVRLECAYDALRITRPAQPAADESVSITACRAGHAHARLGGRKWRVEWTPSTATVTSADADDSASFACAQLVFPLEIRGWRAGDRIRLSYGSKKLKKLFAEAHVPVHDRPAVPVLVDAAGRIRWVAGVARAADAASADGGAVLTITVSHVES